MALRHTEWFARLAEKSQSYRARRWDDFRAAARTRRTGQFDSCRQRDWQSIMARFHFSWGMEDLLMDLAGFSMVNRMRCEHPTGFNHKLDSWSLSDWMVATFGELGEAANILKKLNRVRDGIPGNDKTEVELKADFARELADVFVYLDLMAQAAGVDLCAAIREVFNAKSKKLGCEITV
jgi:NTP pyrophosphatase (non-canonical NTP hydrolase)